MSDDRHSLDDMLRAYGGAPDHLPGFDACLAMGLDAADREMGRAVGGARWLRRREMPGRRRLRLALAGAVAVAIVAAAVLIGLPESKRVMERFFGGSTAQGPVFPGPEPASAATVGEVMRIAQQALRSARTITADFAGWHGQPGGDPQFTSYTHVILAADGSHRLTIDHDTFAWELAYDAGTGVSRVWIGHLGPTPSVRIDTEEYFGIPPGEPDGGDSLAGFSFPVNIGGGWHLLGAVARITRASTDDVAETGMFDGRPVWIVNCPVMPRAPDDPSRAASSTTRGSASPEHVLSISVDQETGLPVRVQSWVDDELQSEGRLVSVKVDEALPEDAFTPGLPTAAEVRQADDGRLSLWIDLGATTTIVPLPFDPETVSRDDVRVSLAEAPGIRVDDGFRRTSIAQVGASIGRAAVVPTWMPGGFQLECVAVKQKQPPPRNSNDLAGIARAGTGIVMLRYGNGFQAITVTTRKLDTRLTSEESPVDLDPFIGDKWPGWTDSRMPIRLTGGAFAGAKGAVVIAPLTMPHLWAVKDRMLLTVAGDATAEALLAVADSIEVSGAHVKARSPAPVSTGD